MPYLSLTSQYNLPARPKPVRCVERQHEYHAKLASSDNIPAIHPWQSRIPPTQAEDAQHDQVHVQTLSEHRNQAPNPHNGRAVRHDKPASRNS